MNEELKNSILTTGTTIIGIVCKDGVVMGADRQSTAGTIVMNKKSEKIKKINEHSLFAGTGSVSDIQKVVKIAAAELRLKELKSRSRPTTRESANLISTIIYQQVRQFTTIPSFVGSLVGGVNEDGKVELYTIDPAGSIIQVEDYDANFGSGMPYVLGLLERQYKKGMSVQEGIALVIEALKSSTQRDVGSGYGIDVYSITKEGVKKSVTQEISPVYKETK